MSSGGGPIRAGKGGKKGSKGGKGGGKAAAQAQAQAQLAGAPPGDRPAGAAPGAASLSSAATRGYNVAHTWDQYAPLTEGMLKSVEVVGSFSSQRPMPSHVTDQSKEEAATDSGDVEPEMKPGELHLENSNQFYKWHSEVEAQRSTQTEEKYKQYAGELHSHMATCDGILAQLDGTLGRLDQLQEQHRTVASSSRTLNEACDRLVGEKERLLEFADALRTKLNYFDELEKVAAQFHSTSLTVGSDHFLPLVKRLDECIAYVASNPQYADAAAYSAKFRQLQSRALGTVRSHCLSVLRHASSQVHAAIKAQQAAGGEGVSASGAVAEGAETSLYYVRFKAGATELRGLIEEMEARAIKPEYARLLSDCHALYCDQRLQLMGEVVQARVAEYTAAQPLATLTRSGCAYLMQVCQLEHQLFDHFFPAAAADPSNLAPLTEPLCTVLYDVLRPVFVQLADIDTLCELVEILRTEVLDEQLARRGESVAGLRPMVKRMLADVQERLTFRTSQFIWEEVGGYTPKPEDIDYPGKLERAAAAAAEAAAEGAEAAAEGAEGGGEGEGGVGSASPPPAAAAASADSYAMWYPPLESTLTVLGRLYRCVSAQIFGGLAQEAVATCSESIGTAAAMVERKAGKLDRQLFVIRHLLILREQIAPFEADFAVVNKELDFTHMRDHLRKIIHGESSVFVLNSNNALVRLATGGAPRVREEQTDSKKELEKQLKATCEKFIMDVTNLTVEPMLSFITKVTAVKVVGAQQGVGAGAGAGAGGARALSEQAFASPQKLEEVVKKVNEALDGALPQAVAKMKLYLTNPATRGILFKPIKSNVAEAHGQIAALLEAEYPPGTVAAVPLCPPHVLEAKLDAMSID